jgi:FtsH-binding integral membrane protein
MIRMQMSPSQETPYPSGVRAAARIWMIMGILLLLALAFLLVVTLGGPASAREASPSMFTVIWRALFCIVLVVVGRQTSKGTAIDTMANGVASLVLGLATLVVAYMQASVFTGPAHLPDPVMLAYLVGAVIGGLGGIALVVAGLLAINGRDAYLAWRRGANS